MENFIVYVVIFFTVTIANMVPHIGNIESAIFYSWQDNMMSTDGHQGSGCDSVATPEQSVADARDLLERIVFRIDQNPTTENLKIKSQIENSLMDIRKLADECNRTEKLSSCQIFEMTRFQTSVQTNIRIYSNIRIFSSEY